MILATVLLSVIVPAQLAPSPDPKPLPVSGMVVDTAGKPVAGAEIWLADGIAPRDHRVFGDEMILEPRAEPVRVWSRCSSTPGRTRRGNSPSKLRTVSWRDGGVVHWCSLPRVQQHGQSGVCRSCWAPTRHL